MVLEVIIIFLECRRISYEKYEHIIIAVCDLTVSAFLNLGGFFFVGVLPLRKTEKQFFPNIWIHKQVFQYHTSSNINVL